MDDRFYAVILAGGKGERFWPLSTARRPKQLLALLGDKTLLAQAVDRLEGLIPPERVLVITSAALVDESRRAAPALPAGNVIGEPIGRDTAAAVALACALVRARRPDGVFCILTADQVMGDLPRYRATLEHSLRLAAEEDALITIGMRPTAPLTSFGYIEAETVHAERGGITFRKARRFVEKPDEVRAKEYVASGRFFWNAGMFIWSVPTLVRALQRHCPHLHALLERLQPVVGTAEFASALGREYPALPKISIDYALMEKSSDIVMAEGTFPWDDVGSWTAVAAHLPADGAANTVVGDVAAVEAGGNIVFSQGRLTALLGVKDLVIVQAEGVTLVCPRSRAQDIKKLVEQVKAAGRYDALL